MGAGLLREGVRGGFVSRAEARGFFRADPHRSLRLLDTLVGACQLSPQLGRHASVRDRVSTMVYPENTVVWKALGSSLIDACGMCFPNQSQASLPFLLHHLNRRLRARGVTAVPPRASISSGEQSPRSHFLTAAVA